MDTPSFLQAIALSATAVVLVTEILKSQYIPVPAQKYKRTTAFVLSIGASIYASYQYDLQNFALVSWQNYLALLFFTFIVSGMTYIGVVKRSQ